MQPNLMPFGEDYFTTTWNKALQHTIPPLQTKVVHPFSPPQKGNNTKTPPIDILPSPMREMIQESITAYGGDGSAPLVWALATLSASTGNLALVHHEGKYWSPMRLPSSLYFSIVGASGGMKTQSGKAFVDPFNKAQAKHALTFADKRAEISSSINVVNSQIQGTKNKIAKATEKGESIDHLKSELSQLEVTRRKLVDSIKGGSWSIDDATPEKILMMMNRTYSRAAYLGSESAVIQNILGIRYGNGSSEHLVLKAYDGEMIKRDRVGSPDDPFAEMVVMQPSLTLLTTFTPTLWDKLVANDSFRSSGFLSRCLPVSIQTTPKNYYAPALNGETISKWDSLIESLCSIPVMVDKYGNPTPHLLGLDDDAYQLFIDHLAKGVSTLERLRADMSNDMIEWANRDNTTILRITSIVHFARYGQDFAKHRIGKMDVAIGFNLFHFFATHFRNLFPSNVVDENTTKVMKWACKRNAPFSKREAYTNVRVTGIKGKSEQIQDALSDALNSGWLAYDTQTKTYNVTENYHKWAGNTTP